MGQVSGQREVKCGGAEVAGALASMSLFELDALNLRKEKKKSWMDARGLAEKGQPFFCGSLLQPEPLCLEKLFSFINVIIQWIRPSHKQV